MAKKYFVNSNLVSGEITPKLSAAQDLAQYHNALESCTNWIVLKFGGLTTRPGTKFVGRIRELE